MVLIATASLLQKKEIIFVYCNKHISFLSLPKDLLSLHVLISV